VIVDRDSALPLWAQVLGDLRRRLASGEFGDRVPGDDELTAQYGVSRRGRMPNQLRPSMVAAVRAAAPPVSMA